MPASEAPPLSDAVGLLERAPLEDVNVADREHFRSDAILTLFARLRREDPVHLHPPGHHYDGPFWSVTRYEDILRVDADHASFSSEPAINIADPRPDFLLPMFIAMDPPRHGARRRVVQPAFSHDEIGSLASKLRAHITVTLDALPVGEPFDWVDRVSIEVTTQLLATLLGFPWEERRLLARWSDVATAETNSGFFKTEDPEAERRGELMACAAWMEQAWAERRARPAGDLISRLAQDPQTSELSPLERLGTLLLLTVGGNDTTRNTISGSVLGLHENPGEWAKLVDRPDRLDNFVAEAIRWQTPLAHMRRIATCDVDLRGKRIRKGDKVVMWYLSGNRDQSVFPDADRLCVERANARRHLAFGFGIHRCVGRRLAELQMRLLWEEVLARFPAIIPLDGMRRVPSCFVRGYEALPVVIPYRRGAGQ